MTGGKKNAGQKNRKMISTMSKNKEQRKCYSCRKEVKSDKMFCKDCEKEDRKGNQSTYVIYNKV